MLALISVGKAFPLGQMIFGGAATNDKYGFAAAVAGA